MKKTLLLMLAALLAGGTLGAQDNDALLDLLIRKKVLSAQEAEDVRVAMVKEQSETSAGKLKLSESISELKLGGDLRLRYQYDNKDMQAPKAPGQNDYANDTQRSRWRFRLRLNADFKLGPEWFGGVQIVTGQASDSDNQTFENGYSDYNIYLSRAYLGWHANDWLTLTAGKVPNALYSTDLVWDSDINPTGMIQQIRFHDMFSREAETTGYAKDGSPITVAAEKPAWALTLNLAEFIYDDNPESAFDNDASADAYMFVAQLLGKYKFRPGIAATFAPGVMFFTAADLSGFSNENRFSDTAVSGETRKLMVLTAPGDISWKWGSIPAKFYWDFAWNTQGQGRFEDIYGLHAPTLANGADHSTVDDIAWLVGLQFGENKKAGDWAIRADYRHTGISSVDPNLNDSDFALGQLNTRGVKSAVTYNVTDLFTLGLGYIYAWNLRDNLSSVLGDANSVQIIQVDANLRF